MARIGADIYLIYIELNALLVNGEALILVLEQYVKVTDAFVGTRTSRQEECRISVKSTAALQVQNSFAQSR